MISSPGISQEPELLPEASGIKLRSESQPEAISEGTAAAAHL